MSDPLLTIQQAAERLGVSTKTIARLVAASQLPAVRVGALKRFLSADLDAYINRNRRYTAAPCQSENTVIIGTFGSKSTASALSVLLAPKRRTRSTSKPGSARTPQIKG